MASFFTFLAIVSAGVAGSHAWSFYKKRKSFDAGIAVTAAKIAIVTAILAAACQNM